MIGIELVSASAVNVFDAGEIIGTGGTAVEFVSGADAFTLGSGYDVNGSVLGGGSGTFQLGGSGDASFDLSDIGPQHSGFAMFNVEAARGRPAVRARMTGPSTAARSWWRAAPR